MVLGVAGVTLGDGCAAHRGSESEKVGTAFHGPSEHRRRAALPPGPGAA